MGGARPHGAAASLSTMCIISKNPKMFGRNTIHLKLPELLELHVEKFSRKVQNVLKALEALKALKDPQFQKSWKTSKSLEGVEQIRIPA